ncbi:MAG: type I-U CRISPR-associated protein Cas7 [Planctomycetaceae bacterium]|nr:type I-U CRISPR-associated protein Cas7 [Planctomycetaceae bacterium]
MTDTQEEAKTPKPLQLTNELLDSWATDSNGPVALHLKQRLLSVEGEVGEDQIIYPPTYADIGYNIDRLADGTRVALIDSVGSQANRLEPAFQSGSGHDLAGLVPQIDIVIRKEPCGKCESCKDEKPPKAEKCKEPRKEKRSLFELAHRAADAVVQCSPKLRPSVKDAFDLLLNEGDAALLCTIAPTSLVFGCWDSRGGSGEKRPRLVRSVIRAWDVDELHSAAQFNSISKSLTEDEVLDLKKAAKTNTIELSEIGMADAPAVTYPGTNRRVLGGIVVRDRIQRDVTINLVALRGLNGGKHTEELRKYLLGLSIMAATADIVLFLREGCHLRYADKDDIWQIVPRRGDKLPIDLTSESSRDVLSQYTATAFSPFKKKWCELKWDDAEEGAVDSADEKGSSDEVTPLEVEFSLQQTKKLLEETAKQKKKKKQAEG